MKIKQIRIQNYKSLKDVTFRPGGLSVLVGPNASGKSNFVDALDFLAKIYRHGLAEALQTKGGFESIVFRQKHAEASISLSLDVFMNAQEASAIQPELPEAISERVPVNDQTLFQIIHNLSFNGTPESNAGYVVTKENFQLITHNGQKATNIFQYTYDKEKGLEQVTPEDDLLGAPFEFLKAYLAMLKENRSTQIFFTYHTKVFLLFNILHLLSNVSVACFSPILCRKPGMSKENPELSPAGEHLPPVVQWLKTKHQKQWKEVLLAMQSILQELEDIDTFKLHDNSIALRLHEKDVGTTWFANQISDGTLLALAILVSIADPRNIVCMIEEPENSVHPWILHTLLKRFRETSSGKYIILTTHSPVLIDHLHPSEILIASRENGETQITPLLELDPDVQQHWENGDYDLSDLLDSGLLPQAIPGGVL